MLRLSSVSAHVAARTRAPQPRTIAACGPRLFATHSAATGTHTGSIAGTVAYHRSYVLLHTRVPPPAFPARVASKLQRQLQLCTSRWGGLVNFAWLPDEAPPSDGAAPSPEWESDEEAYRVSAYAQDRGRINIPRVSMENIDEVVATLQRHACADPEKDLDLSAQSPFELYVYTHGERDCRCGTTGQAVFEALREEVVRQGLSADMKVGAVGHVGGHKYAANVLVFPWGDWLGNVKPELVPQIVEQIHRGHTKLWFNSQESAPPYVEGIWRGRMGLDKLEQLELVGQGTATPEDTPLSPHSSRS